MAAAARLALCALAALLLAGCRPAAAPALTAPPATLAAPGVHVTPAATFTPTPLSTEVAPTPSPVPDLPLDAARAAYGDRLIDWVKIDAIHVLAPVTPVGWTASADLADPASAWDSPEAQVGWALSSALPDEPTANVVLYGHNNIHSSVFLRLSELKPGDDVTLLTAQREYAYTVSTVEILPVLHGESDAAYAEYLKPGRAPRLTLVSCWPPQGNSHRVVVVAYPQQ